MKRTRVQREQVATILRTWNGSDAGHKASPNTVAQEIDELYRAYYESLPAQTEAILAGQKAWERKVA